MTYADIILPLPLDSLFTYSVPDSLAGRVGQGIRVLVPFGKSKTYVGLVVRTHNNKPDFNVKDISTVMDDAPVVNAVQLELWRWMADYYLSSVGDVMNAALPSGLKSEDGYTAKTETYVSLAPEYHSERAIRVALDVLKRATAQLKVFETFLTLSHWDTISGDTCAEPVAEVSRDELMNETHSTSAVFRNLVVRKFLNTYEREIGRLNNAGEPHPELIKPLNEAQQTAYNNIVFSFLKKNVVLLHGVTSSGKTEIYIHLIRQAIERRQQVLYLLPEIALTVQIRQRLQRVFGNRLGIYHSKYSDAERVEIWKKQLSAAPYDVILGARSAVLLPFTNLGLVIIDEEHETSFKQQDPAPRYHARSVAIMLARKFGAKVLLGSATPSLESWNNAHTGKFGLVSLMQRYNDIRLPEIEVVDIKDLQRRKMMSGPFSPRLMAAVRKALDNGEQAILFQNRRGFAPMIECRECGWVPHCDKCDVSLTYHKSLGQLTCHYCGTTYTVPEVCPCCGSRNLRGRGYGTEKVEDYVMELFPDARVARMDLDTTRTRNAYERLISDFSAHKTDILIGTQMVSKGLDFDKVSVVGILNADSMLNYPDFRAYEHAFMMMAQVAGRAGRKGKQGFVILQTKSPQLPVITQVVRNDCEGLFADQLEERQAFCYPPFCHLIYVFLKHRDDAVVASASMRLGDILRGWFGSRVLGPDKPSVSKVKTLNIRKIMLKLENGIDLAKVRLYLRKAQAMMGQDAKYRSVQIYFDVDPL
ncbi:MAG: primosomal protein N' [Prevotella sp.]|uniref:replication restart helicase PriA n=1 Tax=Prevotella sp. TaxID=59823 RepID=UPI00257A2DA9|nr:primosomal protein N' [Prevotella sp.]MBS5875265.1 primosomal protein N' [Prevotella sp.]